MSFFNCNIDYYREKQLERYLEEDDQDYYDLYYVNSNYSWCADCGGLVLAVKINHNLCDKCYESYEINE